MEALESFWTYHLCSRMENELRESKSGWGKLEDHWNSGGEM